MGSRRSFGTVIGGVLSAPVSNDWSPDEYVERGLDLSEAIARQMPGARPSVVARAQDLVIGHLASGIDRGGVPAVIFPDGSIEVPWLRERVQLPDGIEPDGGVA